MALRRISLKDFVIVKGLDLALNEGFTALTGETGAGKSILIDALQLCLGARADATTVREGAQRADIWAEFDAPGVGSALEQWLSDAGYEAQDALLLRRSVELDGKSRGWINGSPATASQLRQLGEQLVDIHGQHAWAALTRSGEVRKLLDTFAALDTQPLAKAYTRWREAQTQWQEAEHSQAQQQAEREQLLWQLGELRRLDPHEGEWAEINQQHGRLANAQSLLEASQLAINLLDQDDTGAVAALAQSHQALAALQNLEPAFGAIAEELAASLAQAQDAVYSLQAYLRRADLDPEGLAALDERISQWMGLSRRFKTAPEALPALRAQWEVKLAALDAASDLDALARKVSTCRAHYDAEAAKVSQCRAEAAPRLGQTVTAAMQTLGMPGGQLVVALEALDQPTASGVEEVQFLVAGHAGSTPKAIAKVASGGELSRIALALAVVAQQAAAAPTLIFDEVDAGVGGTVAQAVGRLMRELGQSHQVMAVTHLPQVAAYAHHHLRVSKQSEGEQTLSQVSPLSETERQAEIARMLAGEPLTPTSLAHAKEMLAQGNAAKAAP